MLNYNKIHSSINFDRTSKRELAKWLNIGASTFRSRLERENLTPDDVYRLAQFFKKPIGYFFDEEDPYSAVKSNARTEEPEIKTYNCPDCLSKQKEIDLLKREIELLNTTLDAKDTTLDAQEELLESYRGKREIQSPTGT